jgi:hypothetical protein
MAVADDDWIGVRSTLEQMERELSSVALEDFAREEAGRLPFGLSGQLELRDFCALPLDRFSIELIHEDCDDLESCKLRREELVNRTAALGNEALSNAADAVGLAFIADGADLIAGARSEQDQLPFRAAADVWMRNWALSRHGAGPRPSDENILLMKAWCGLAERNSEFGLAWIAEKGFPSDATPVGRKQVAALVYAAEHIASDLPSVSAFRRAAETTFRNGDLSAYYMVQLLDTERTAFDGRQIVGSFTTCREGRAVYDPPVVDERAGDQTRVAYGLSSGRVYLEQASRRCAMAEAAGGR